MGVPDHLDPNYFGQGHLGSSINMFLFMERGGAIASGLNLNLNGLLVKRQIDNPSPGAVTGGN